MTVTILQGDCLDVLRTLPDASVHCCVTDPPYHLTANKKGGSGVASVNLESPYGRSRIGTGNGAGGFMGQAWDGGDVAFRAETWAEVLRVLKPGAHLLAFSGTRTYHRMTCAIEDAGFEIRDQIGWAFGQGFPKSHNLDGDWQGWGTALKPAWEPICVARKQVIGTVAQNVAAHGTGALNIDGCRVATDPETDDPRLGGAGAWKTDKAAKNVYEGGFAGKDIASSALGRWPANIIHDGSDEVLAAFPQAPGQQGPIVSDPERRKTQNVYGAMARGGEPTANKRYTKEGVTNFAATPGARRNDSGSAARFFYNCSEGDEEWLWQTGLANVAGPDLPLQNPRVVSVLNAAATSALPEGMQSSVVAAPSIRATPGELKNLCASVIEAMRHTEAACWLGLLPAKPTALRAGAKCAAHRTPTGTMTITISHWMSDGSADPVTFSITQQNTGRGAAGSPSRLYYCAKASRADRNDGLDGMEEKPLLWSAGTQNPGSFQSEGTKKAAQNNHPTVKPTELMRYLCRLVTPPGGIVLDPFMGSGSTGRGAALEGFSFIGIELNPDYIEIAQRRIDAAAQAKIDEAPLFAGLV